MKKILIRTDGGHKLGLGHIIRCLSLASMLRDQFQITFYLKDPAPSLPALIRDKKFDVVVIYEEETFLKTVNKKDIVVLDGYHFDTACQQRIKNSGAVLVCIDDLHDRHFVADVIINQAPGVTKEKYSAEPFTRYLLGPTFALLRPSFLRQASRKRDVGKIRSAMICFGGSDAKNLTIPALNTMLAHPVFEQIVVVTGSAYAFTGELNAITRSDDRIRHYHAVDEEEMVRVIVDVQLAVVPASGILFEVIACKTPVISGFYVDNQLGIYQGFKDQGVFYDAGGFEELNLKRAIHEALSTDPVKQLGRHAACIDGKSVERYIEIFHKLQP